MWIFVLIAFLIIAAAISVRCDERMTDVLSFTTGLLILLLYILAFFRALSAIDLIASVIILMSGAFFLGKKSSDRKKIFGNMCEKLLSPETIILLLVCVIAVFCEKDRIFTWWDDINFWATDTKSLFYLNGFAGKYGNCAPEFGDYPPGIQLFKWLFLHINPDQYIEGLQFAGYYVLNMIFMLPLAGSVAAAFEKTFTGCKRAVIRVGCYIVSFILAIMIPGIVDGMHFGGTCADITMGIVYGALLHAMWDRQGHSDSFYIMRICIYTCILVLTKSVGIEWALFAFIFWITVCGQRGKKLWIPVIFAAITEGSWLGFCLMMRRVAKLTSAGLHMVGSDYQLPGDAGDKLSSFIKAFTGIAMHSDSNLTFDLPPVAMLVILILIPVIFGMTGLLPDNNHHPDKNVKAALRIRKHILHTTNSHLLMYVLFTAAASYGIIFLAHITVFRGEQQYLDPANMALSISRYGAPFTLGTLYLMIGIVSLGAVKESSDDLENAAGHSRKNLFFLIGFGIFILLTADYTGMFRAAYGYRATMQEDISYRENMIDEKGRQFIKLVESDDEMHELAGHRILYLRDPEVIHWVKDTYISAEVSPAAVVYGELRASDGIEYARNLAAASHAEYIYAEEQTPELEELLAELVGEDNFCYGKVYSIVGD